MRRSIRFVRDFLEFRQAAKKSRPRLTVFWKDRYPCLGDNTRTTGFDRHYIYHTAWAARVLAETRPHRHVDISSCLYFASIASAFVPIDFYDYRPARLLLSNLRCESADLMQLPFADKSIASLSCMHVIEHIGLGRYGDPIDPDADLKAMRELQRVIAPGGNLLVVTPVGEPRIQFNAHRIYSYDQVRAAFPELRLSHFALIPERSQAGELIANADPLLVAKERYGCGCFWFTRAS